MTSLLRHVYQIMEIFVRELCTPKIAWELTSSPPRQMNLPIISHPLNQVNCEHRKKYRTHMQYTCKIHMQRNTESRMPRNSRTLWKCMCKSPTLMLTFIQCHRVMCHHNTVTAGIPPIKIETARSFLVRTELLSYRALDVPLIRFEQCLSCQYSHRNDVQFLIYFMPRYRSYEGLK